MPTKTVRIIITIYEKLGDKIMITMQPTEHLVGINVQGDYYDFEAFVDAAHRLTGMWPDEDYTDPYYSCGNRLLGICRCFCRCQSIWLLYSRST